MKRRPFLLTSARGVAGMTTAVLGAWLTHWHEVQSLRGRNKDASSYLLDWKA